MNQAHIESKGKKRMERWERKQALKEALRLQREINAKIKEERNNERAEPIPA